MTIVGTRRMIVYDDLQNQEKLRIYDVRVERPPHYNSSPSFNTHIITAIATSRIFNRKSR